MPALGGAGAVLSAAFPVLTGIQAISSVYETYKDLKSPDYQVPKKAKVLSVAKSIVSVWCGLVPGLFEQL